MSLLLLSAFTRRTEVKTKSKHKKEKEKKEENRGEGGKNEMTKSRGVNEI